MHVAHAVKEGQRFAADHNLEVVTCPSCRLVYAIPESLASSARAYPGGSPNGWHLFCPMGHGWSYVGKSIAEQLREERRRVEATRDLLAQEERSHNATKGHLTRQKRRAAAGVCPCCNRTFQQLARHMKGQHPDFVERAEGHLPLDVAKPEVGVALDDVLASFLLDGPRRWAEIRDHLRLSDADAANFLTKMRAQGKVERVERGLYRKGPTA